MLELVREHTQARTIARHVHVDEAWDLDEPHRAVWEAIRRLFPAHAMVDQVDHGCLLVSWTLREGRRGGAQFAAPVMIRIGAGLLLALWTCEGVLRREIAAQQAEVVGEALACYDPHSRIPSCGVILLGD